MTSQTALAVAYPVHVSDLFEPVPLDTFAGLVLEHDELEALMRQLYGLVGPVVSGTHGKALLRYFAEGNNLDGAEAIAGQLFELPRALKRLSADYWKKAMALTDCYEEMVADDKREWEAMLRRLEDEVAYGQTLPAVPDFTPANIQATFAQLIADRSTSFAKRVDGVFKALSPNHKTNRPQGFRSKLILAKLLDAGPYSFGRWSDFEYLRDLRRVIGTFMGRGRYDDGKSDLHKICKDARDYSWGEWVWVDGNSWAVKAYKNGNIHVQLHDEMVYRLNMVLASLYPQALAPEALAKPKKRRRKAELQPDVLSFATVAFLRDHSKVDSSLRDTWRIVTPDFRYRELNKQHRQTYERVMSHLGGVEVRGGWEFDYNPAEQLAEVVRTGVVPDRIGHQFYPTPPTVAELLVEAAELYDGCDVLEPSAGTGNLVAAIKKAARCTVVAVELADLHVKVLRSRFRKLELVHGDFLDQTVEDLGGDYDRVVMNPPFAGGRAREHVEHAATMLRVGGRLAAVVPPGCRDLEIEGCTVQVAHEIPNAFEDTSITVLILAVERVEA